jgi:hypothetical protein
MVKVIQIAVTNWETDEGVHRERLFALLDDGRIFVRDFFSDEDPDDFVEIPADQMPWRKQ